MSTFICCDCKQELPVKTDGGTGYGLDPETNGKICYDCCGKRDKQSLIETGKGYLYLVKDSHGYKVTNWPGTLAIRCGNPKQSYHNIARHRYDVWFHGPDGKQWHGIQYGDNTQVCHVRRTKA